MRRRLQKSRPSASTAGLQAADETISQRWLLCWWRHHPAFISRPPRRHPFQRTPRPNPPSTTTGGAPQRARGPRWDCQHGAAQRQRRQGAAIPALVNGASGSYCRLGFGRMVCPGQMGPIWGGILRKTIMCRRLTGPPRTIGQAVYPTAIWPLTYYLVVSDIDGAWSYPQMQQKTGVKTPLNGHPNHVGYVPTRRPAKFAVVLFPALPGERERCTAGEH